MFHHPVGDEPASWVGGLGPSNVYSTEENCHSVFAILLCLKDGAS